MEKAPELIAGQYALPCLLHFLYLMRQVHKGTSLKAQSLSTLLKVSAFCCMLTCTTDTVNCV
jgi:hypothetical protein